LNYYNENEQYAVRWLCNLIESGLIPPGEVDERSIVDVRPEDLKGYSQCHFFAGIGGWPLALALAGWPADEPVWTGSCPCQPFSVAGRRKGNTDERHLWPEFFRLIKECRPAAVFGEQVASPLGRSWLDGVFTGLESENYSCGAAIIGAHSLGAPHVRNRIFWVANAAGVQRETGAEICGVFSEVRGDGAVADKFNGSSETFWASSVSIPCLDGKARRIGPGIMPLANGIPARVGKIRAFGNAIVPPIAAKFIMACGLRPEDHRNSKDGNEGA